MLFFFFFFRNQEFVFNIIFDRKKKNRLKSATPVNVQVELSGKENAISLHYRCIGINIIYGRTTIYKPLNEK